MKNLQSLVLRDVKLDYQVMSDLAPTSKVQTLSHSLTEYFKSFCKGNPNGIRILLKYFQNRYVSTSFVISYVYTFTYGRFRTLRACHLKKQEYE